MEPTIDELAEKLDLPGWFPYQLDAFDASLQLSETERRVCLFYRTGAGKSATSLAMARLWGQEAALVVAPPSTHDTWREQADRIGLAVTTVSHAKFRQKEFKVSRHTMIILDEFHLLGGHKGMGWKKLDRIARGLLAPLIIASATPSYNDAERVYCIQHVLHPHTLKGGYIEFLYQNCNTKQNPFGMEPLVDDEHPFRNYADATEYLAKMDNVYYLPDNVQYTIRDLNYGAPMPGEFDNLSFDPREVRIMASGIEKEHRRVAHHLLEDDGSLRLIIRDMLMGERGHGPTLVFAQHSSIAVAIDKFFARKGYSHMLITGKTSEKDKLLGLQLFREGKVDWLIGTASLGTGTDGLDKVCDRLIIVDDTNDDAFRRQLIGRIMPRGASVDASQKKVFRYNALEY